MKDILYGMLVVMVGNSLVTHILLQHAASIGIAFYGIGLLICFIGVIRKR